MRNYLPRAKALGNKYIIILPPLGVCYVYCMKREVSKICGAYVIVYGRYFRSCRYFFVATFLLLLLFVATFILPLLFFVAILYELPVLYFCYFFTAGIYFFVATFTSATFVIFLYLCIFKFSCRCYPPLNSAR